MSEPPTISIITVVRNAAADLQYTLRSLQELTYRHVELIVIDGASTDETLSVIQRHASSISHWVSEADSGVYDAMNKGLTVATGDYVWFVNAGDSPAAATLFDELHHVDTLPDFIFGDTNFIDRTGAIVGRSKAPASLTWRTMSHGMHVSHQSFLARRDIAPLYDFRYRYIADQKWMVDVLRAGRNGLRMEQPVSNYLIGGISDVHYMRCVKEKLRYTYEEFSLPRALMVTLEEMFKVGKRTVRGVFNPRQAN